MTLKTRGERAKAIRGHLKKTQREIASKIGVKTSYYSDIENNRRPITDKFAEKLKLAFGISSEWLMDGSGEMYPKNVPFNVPLNGESESKPDIFRLYEDLEKERPELLGIAKMLRGLESDLNDSSLVFRKYLIDGFNELYQLKSRNYLDYKKKAIRHLEAYVKYKKAITPLAKSLKQFIEKDFPPLDDKNVLSNPDQD